MSPDHPQDKAKHYFLCEAFSDILGRYGFSFLHPPQPQSRQGTTDISLHLFFCRPVSYQTVDAQSMWTISYSSGHFQHTGQWLTHGQLHNYLSSIKWIFGEHWVLWVWPLYTLWDKAEIGDEVKQAKIHLIQGHKYRHTYHLRIHFTSHQSQ